ncbi:AXIN1 up-regulated 1 [Musca autumnalis]|uniref:AXIN1 up-regulated 1 n=1 Tax=Musca autumnalis TaxID=221902 RepID=UPI003CF14047
MFTPIKNLITYIQKNANFGSNTTGATNSEENSKMETKDKLNSQTVAAANGVSDGESVKGHPKDEHKSDRSAVETNKNSTIKLASTSASNSTTVRTTLPQRTMEQVTAATCSAEYEDDDDDIESQIESSIMLKKPVKDGSNKNNEILEVKKSPDRSIVIGHDCGPRSLVVASPIDDELEDFRHAPPEVITSSPINNHNHEDDEGEDEAEVICVSEEHKESGNKNVTEKTNGYISQGEEAKEYAAGKGEKGHESILISDTSGSEKYNDTSDKINLVDSEFEDVEDRAETLSSQSADEGEEAEEDDDSDVTFLDLDNFPDSEVIVISENTQENSAMMPIDSTDAASTSDDPLAIACDEEEAFAADKMSALQELNLLNTSANSQDEDTRTTATTTADDDILWIRTDTVTTTTAASNEQASCSKSSMNILSNGENVGTPEKDERNGEGSDSGLGSETSALHTTNTSIVDTSHLNMTSSVAATPVTSPVNGQLTKNQEKDISSEVIKTTPTKPIRSNLKRRLEVDHDDVVDTLRNITSSASTSTSTSSASLSGNANKKPKRSINFDTVQVYYFPRQQGFSCVPSAGGCTLGMGARHVGFKTMTLAEHAAELRRAHRMQLQEINPRGSSSDDSEESEEDYLSEGSGSDLDGESNGFLQPVSPKQRRTILKAAGVRKIDASEKAECRDIRNSREVCGCSCREFCDPETCACSQSGIKCQVDRDMFPCGCTRDACGNTIGRVEFNPSRVRTHFIHTLMRLDMEKRQQQNPYTPAAVVPTATVNSSSYYQSHLQPQSNYSSGYASPAYNPSADMHQQNAASNFYHQHHQPTTSTGGMYGSGGGGASMDMSHATSTSSASYGIDNIDSSGIYNSAGSSATPSYGELIPVASYHPHHNMNYGNVSETQMSGYNSYHNNAATSYINTNASTNMNNTSTNYSSCSVPSLPPYGAATTTEASATYHSVSSLTTLETTTAPSYTKAQTSTLMDNDDVGTSFINLTTPLASSSRLTQQINDLLENNRNNSTALVAVSAQSIDETMNSGSSGDSNKSRVAPLNGISGDESTRTEMAHSSNSSNTSINTPPIEDVNKSCVYASLQTAIPPLKPAPIVVDNNEAGPEKLPAPPPAVVTSSSSPSISLEEEKENNNEEATQIPISATETTTATTTEPMIDLATQVVSKTEETPVQAKTEEVEEKVDEDKMDTAETVSATTSGETSDLKAMTETTVNVVEIPAADAPSSSSSPASPAEAAPSSAIEVAVAAGN